ncbi:MAG: hypothetical protein MJE12_27630 [Alphaproteobacteria bacterium]|nr:hypothetical protein [Alphaproteobacteria bacterium]
MQKTTQQVGVLTKAPLTKPAINSRWLLALLYVALFAVVAWPVLSVTVPPLVDYPNHLARAHILTTWDSTPALQRNYVVDWNLRPNMAFEVLMLPLTQFLSIYDAGRAVILLTLLAILGGTLTMHKVLHGRVGLWPVITYLFLFNHALFWGFLSYLFAAGLALFAFSGWIYCRDRSLFFRTLAFSVASLILYFGHLFGLLAYAIAVVGYEIWRTFPNKRDVKALAREWMVTAAQFVMPGVLFLYWVVQNRSLDRAFTFYGTLNEKLVAIISPAYFGMPLIDGPIVIFAAMVFVWCRNRKGVQFAPALKVPVLLMAVAALMMPHVLSDVWLIDIRLPLVLACLVIAGIRFQPETVRAERTIASLAIVTVALRSIFVFEIWRPIDRQFNEFRTAVQAINDGASLLVVQDHDDVPPGKIAQINSIYWHLGALGVIEKSIFYPHLFTGHTSVDVSPTRRIIDTPSGTPISREVLAESVNPADTNYTIGQRFSRYIWIFWDGWPNTFDYVLNVRFDNLTNPAPRHLTQYKSGSFFDIHRIVREPVR